MAVILSLAGLGIAFLAGLGVIYLLCPRLSGLRPAEVCGTAMILGAGIVAILSFWLGFFLPGLLLRATVVLVCLALPIVAWKRHKEASWKFSKPRVSASGVILAALVACQLYFVTWFSLRRAHLGWDGLFNWEAKARIAFLNHGAIPMQYFRSGYDVFHVRYPPLVPILEVWMYGFLGRADQSMAKLIGPYFYLAAALLLTGYAMRETNRRLTAIVAFLFFALAPKLALSEGSASSGYADFPLGAIYLCAVVHCMGYGRSGSLESARLAGAAAVLLPFTKSEGALLLLCLATAVVPAVVAKRDWKAGAWMIVPGVSLFLGWTLFLALAGAPRETTFLPVTPGVFMAHLSRARPLLSWTLEELTFWSRWSLLWPITAAALAYLIARTRRSYWYPWTAAVCMPLILYPFIFFFSAWDLAPHVGSSLHRLLVHVAPTATLMIGLVYGIVLDAGKSGRSRWWNGVQAVQVLPTERVEALLREAAEVLQPTGITLQDLQQAYRDVAAEELMKEAAALLRPTAENSAQRNGDAENPAEAQQDSTAQKEPRSPKRLGALAAAGVLVLVILLVIWFTPFRRPTIRLRLTLPGKDYGATEPILQLGRASAAADALGVKYISAGRISLLYDHWGAPPCESPPEPVYADGPHLIEFRINSDGRSTSVLLDGSRVLNCAGLYSQDLSTRVLGKNTLGFTTMRSEFSGRLELVSDHGGQ